MRGGMTSCQRIMPVKCFAEHSLELDYPLPNHNFDIAGDNLSSISLNFVWRRVIVDALKNHLDVQNDSLDPAISSEIAAQINNLIDDLYN